MSDDNYQDSPSGLLWGVVYELTNLARAFDITGNARVAMSLAGCAHTIKEAIESYQKETGKLTHELMQASWSGTFNVLKATMVGLNIGTGDIEQARLWAGEGNSQDQESSL